MKKNYAILPDRIKAVIIDGIVLIAGICSYRNFGTI